MYWQDIEEAKILIRVSENGSDSHSFRVLYIFDAINEH
jgi:hypothetical protein